VERSFLDWIDKRKGKRKGKSEEEGE